MSEYYVPDISEFHSGFEYDFHNDMGWIKMVFGSPFDGYSFTTANNMGLSFERAVKYGAIRAKCLDAADIEELGFPATSEARNHFGELIKDNKTFYIRLWENNEVEIYEDYGELSLIGTRTYFCGKIKNKSELKKVLSMVL